MRTVHLTEYEYTMCVLFSEESARYQQVYAHGNRQMPRRGIRKRVDDTLCGKMAEVAVAKMLREDYRLHLPVNYEVYPVGEWDDEDIVVKGTTIDVKSTKATNAHFLLLEKSKIDFRIKEGNLPDMYLMCITDMEQRLVNVVGCIGTGRLLNMDNPKVRLMKAGENIPGTETRMQTDNYCVNFDALCDTKTAFDYVLSREMAV